MESNLQPTVNNITNTQNPNIWQNFNMPRTVAANQPIATPAPTQSDSFQKEKDDKKKKIIIATTLIATAVAVTIAIVKRKQIGEFFSKLKKKPPETPTGGTKKPLTTGVPPVKTNVDFPMPEFGATPTAAQKSAYINSIMDYTNHTDKALAEKSLDAIRKYGTWEDLDKIGFVRMSDDENLIRSFTKTVAKIGRAGQDDFHILEPIFATKHNLSNDTYIEILKAVDKLSTDAGKKYPNIIRLFNKVGSETDPLLGSLSTTLSKLGTNSNVEDFNKYLRNYNYANEFIGRDGGGKTPEFIKGVIDKIIGVISGR